MLCIAHDMRSPSVNPTLKLRCFSRRSSDTFVQRRVSAKHKHSFAEAIALIGETMMKCVGLACCRLRGRI